MPLLAVWFPSVGMFGVVLAAFGAIVPFLTFTGRKRIGIALIFALLGIGELASIHKADIAHEAEVRNQHFDVENLNNQLHKSETQRQVDNAILRTKLEDYAGLSQLRPALMKLAQTSAEFQKKQYETKVLSDRDLYDLTMKAVKNIRDFSAKYAQLDRDRDAELMSPAFRQMTDVERRQKWADDANRSIQLYYAKQAEFESAFLPVAIYARNELLKRKLPEPPLDPSEKSKVNMVLSGTLAESGHLRPT